MNPARGQYPKAFIHLQPDFSYQAFEACEHCVGSKDAEAEEALPSLVIYAIGSFLHVTDSITGRRTWSAAGFGQISIPCDSFRRCRAAGQTGASSDERGMKDLLPNSERSTLTAGPVLHPVQDGPKKR